MHVVANSFIQIICCWIIIEQILRILFLRTLLRIRNISLCLFCLLWIRIHFAVVANLFSRSATEIGRSKLFTKFFFCLNKCASIVHWWKTRSVDFFPISLDEWIESRQFGMRPRHTGITTISISFWSGASVWCTFTHTWQLQLKREISWKWLKIVFRVCTAVDADGCDKRRDSIKWMNENGRKGKSHAARHIQCRSICLILFVCCAHRWR